MSRDEIIEAASELINGAREEDYGAPSDNFRNIAERWSQHVGVRVTPHMVALMMVDLKVARMATTGKRHNDSLVDIVGYAALCGEVSDL